MARGGARPGAGRAKNGANRLTEEAHKKAAASGILPLDYLLAVMRDEGNEVERRVDAAKAAAPYIHPKRQPVDDRGSTEQKAVLTVATGVPRA